MHLPTSQQLTIKGKALSSFCINVALYSEEALYTLSETDIFTQADISLNLYPDQNIILISLGCVCNIYIYSGGWNY